MYFVFQTGVTEIHDFFMAPSRAAQHTHTHINGSDPVKQTVWAHMLTSRQVNDIIGKVQIKYQACPCHNMLLQSKTADHGAGSRFAGRTAGVQGVTVFVSIPPFWPEGSCCRSAAYKSPSKLLQLGRCSARSWAARRGPFWGTRVPRGSRGESPNCLHTAIPVVAKHMKQYKYLFVCFCFFYT